VGVAADAVGGTISRPEDPVGRVTGPERPKGTIIKSVRGEGVRGLIYFARSHLRAQKSLDFQGPPLPMPLVMDVARLKTITYRAI
jgi:hypothetical protein